MIFYFSGTGNSRYAAETLGSELKERVYPITFKDGSDRKPEGNSIGFVFPVYSWGVPPIVLRYIEKLNTNLRKFGKTVPVWAIFVCGDEVALAPEMLKASLRHSGLLLSGGWSLQMPNNYVLLPGFDVDSKEVENEKLRKAPSAIKSIADKIKNEEWEENYVRGSMAWIKSKFIYPLFVKWGINPKNWRVTDACVGCILCKKSCPVDNITMTADKTTGHLIPKWGKECVSCLACYHICPRNAVQYSGITRKKGQYYLQNNR